MKKYIDLNSKLRTKAKSEFEKDFFQAHEQLCVWQDHVKHSKPSRRPAR